MASAPAPRPSLALLAQDAFVRPSGIARYQAELVTHLAGRTNLHLLVVRPSHVKAAHGSMPEPMRKAALEHYTKPATVLRNLPAIFRGFLHRPDLFDWHPTVFLNILSARLFTGAYIDRAGFDLVHGTSSYLPLTRGKAARVITIHDTTPLSMPQSHTRNTIKGFVRPFEITPEIQVICDTKSGLNDLLAVVDHPPENSHVIHLGIDRTVFFPAVSAPDGSIDPYLLSVGTIEPRKNLPRALSAFERVASSHPDLRWKVAGQRGWGWAEFSKALSKSPRRDRVDVLGPVPDKELGELYRKALAFVFPTIWEGFGFPVIEALACGTAVAASKLPALEEVGGSSFVPLDPAETASIAEAIEKAAFDENGRAARRSAGIEQVSRFDWARTGEQTLDVYAKALGRPKADLVLPETAG